MASFIFIKPTGTLIHKIIQLNDNEFIKWYKQIVEKGEINIDKYLISHCHELHNQCEHLDNISTMLKLFQNKYAQPKFLLIIKQKTVIDIKRELVYELTSKYL